MATNKPTGYVLYRGPSLINGAPIVAVAITSKSSNSKTGNMVQTYILADSGENPVQAVKSGADRAVCGDCIHRQGANGDCYVNLGQGALAVWKALQRGAYPADAAAAARASAGRMVRLGTYGDPAAVPVAVWQALLAQAAGNTGYTHQWRNESVARELLALCMASADTPQDRADALAMGYRTFRVRNDSQAMLEGEFACPASEEQGKRKTCAQCGACNGGLDSNKASPVIIVHGTLKTRMQARYQ